LASWKGKTRGGLFGQKFFVFILKNLGLKPAYFVLRFVACYFFLFSYKSSKHIFHYFHKVLKYPYFRSIINLYKNYYIFGQTLLDKVAIRAGIDKSFTFSMDGENYLHQMAAEGRGGILISAHVGNWDISGHLLMQRLKAKIHIVMFDAEHQNIKKYLDSIIGNEHINIIVVKEDLSHIFHINKALQNKDLVCIHGDRYVEGAKVIAEEFLGRKTYFPYGAFHIASKFKVPYTFVFGFREHKNHYHFYSTPLKVNEGGVRPMVKEYSQALEEHLLKYPIQWFNYYDYWAEVPKEYVLEK
jgi:predicted LPLAT superfamily acyltransferase